jgi:hypothetical protein
MILHLLVFIMDIFQIRFRNLIYFIDLVIQKTSNYIDFSISKFFLKTQLFFQIPIYFSTLK